MRLVRTFKFNCAMGSCDAVASNRVGGNVGATAAAAARAAAGSRRGSGGGGGVGKADSASPALVGVAAARLKPFADMR